MSISAIPSNEVPAGFIKIELPDWKRLSNQRSPKESVQTPRCNMPKMTDRPKSLEEIATEKAKHSRQQEERVA
eukprot:gene22523-27491_t